MIRIDFVSDRAVCFIQAVQPRDHSGTVRASFANVRNAANALIMQCASGDNPVGGYADNIGIFTQKFDFIRPIWSSDT